MTSRRRKFSAAKPIIFLPLSFSSSSFSTLYFFLLLSSHSMVLISWKAEAVSNPQVTVMGMVYCDICSNNTFSNHSFFIPGVQVKIECTFKASSPRTAEEISFSVARSTNKYGIYQLHIPSVDGIDCASEEGNHCRASLMLSSTSSCNIPGSATTSDEIAIKSKGENTCIYSLSALNYRPSKRNASLCGGGGGGGGH